MRLGIFGGSFDPIHYGHLVLAERCREQANLDQVWFVPSAMAPHKENGPALTDRQRVELIELALAGHDAFICSDIELKRGGISYTVDTLSEIRNAHPDDELFFMMGADSLHQFDRWREPEKICQLAIPLVVNRPGSDDVELDIFAKYVEPDRLRLIKEHLITSPMINISSSEIRRRVAAKQTIRYLLPRAVEKYIESQKLYQIAEPIKGK